MRKRQEIQEVLRQVKPEPTDEYVAMFASRDTSVRTEATPTAPNSARCPVKARLYRSPRSAQRLQKFTIEKGPAMRRPSHYVNVYDSVVHVRSV